MAQSNYGSSMLVDAKRAGKEAAMAAIGGLPDAKLLLVDSGVKYDLKEMLSGIAQAAPNAAVIGNTSFNGVIPPAGYASGDDSFVSILPLDELVQSASAVLQQLKERCGKQPTAFHLVRCGGHRAGIGDRMGEVAQAVQKAAGDIPFLMEFTFGEVWLRG